MPVMVSPELLVENSRYRPPRRRSRSRREVEPIALDDASVAPESAGMPAPCRDSETIDLQQQHSSAGRIGGIGYARGGEAREVVQNVSARAGGRVIGGERRCRRNGCTVDYILAGRGSDVPRAVSNHEPTSRKLTVTALIGTPPS